MAWLMAIGFGPQLSEIWWRSCWHKGAFPKADPPDRRSGMSPASAHYPPIVSLQVRYVLLLSNFPPVSPEPAHAKARPGLYEWAGIDTFWQQQTCSQR